MCLCFHVLSYSHTLLIEFKTYTILCSLYIFLVYFNAVRNVLGCWLRDYAPEVTLVDERNTRWGSSFFSWLLKQSASMSKTVRSLYIFTPLKHCPRLYKSAICLCPKVSCCSKYYSKISSRRHHKAQRALFVFEYGRDACASRWAERRRTVNCCSCVKNSDLYCNSSSDSISIFQLEIAVAVSKILIFIVAVLQIVFVSSNLKLL